MFLERLLLVVAVAIYISILLLFTGCGTSVVTLYSSSDSVDVSNKTNTGEDKKEDYVNKIDKKEECVIYKKNLKYWVKSK